MPTHAFICGLHRSGTTLVARLLAEHRDVTGFQSTGEIEDEGQYLQSVYPIENEYGSLGRFGFDERIRLTEASPLLTEANVHRLATEWGRHWDPERSVRVEKTPSNILRSRFLQAAFPDSRFVIVTRHPVASALATLRFTNTGIFTLLYHWVVVYEKMLEDLPHLRYAMMVPYEALASAPEATMSRIESFLGLEPCGHEINVRSDINEAYFRQWQSEFFVSTDRARPLGRPTRVPWARRIVRHGRAALQAAALRRLFPAGTHVYRAQFDAQDAVAALESRVARFGYSLKDLDKAPAVREISRGVSSGADPAPKSKSEVQ